MAGAGLRTWTTLEDRFSSRANSIGFMRHALAVFVLVGHTWPLGFGLPSLGSPAWHKQTDLGTMSVYGFFVLSGFLITASGLKFGIGRFGWHRFLRIFPGFWVCLLVTAIAIGPIAALLESRSLHDYFTHPWGPLRYVAVNWSTSMDQFSISGLLTTTPSAGGKPGAFDGSLWSLKYELLCYVLVGILAVTAIIKRVRVAVVGLALAGYAGLVWYVVSHGEWLLQTPHLGAYGPYPVIGAFSRGRLLVLGTLFLIGATAKLYSHRLPLHPLLGAVATAALALGLWQGGFLVVGLPAFAYLLLYATVALPRLLHPIGRRRDYSYGIYIYAFPVQQLIALAGGARLGIAGFIAASVLGTLALAVPSWHLIERPAMALKDLAWADLASKGFSRWHRSSAPPPPAATAEEVAAAPILESGQPVETVP